MGGKLLLCWVLSAASVAAFARDHRKAVLMRIDSDFVAVERSLPAGEYYLWEKGKNRAVLWSVNGRDAIELSTAPVLRPIATAEPSMFFINKDGVRCLWRYFPANSMSGIEVAVPGPGTADNKKIPQVTFVSDKASLLATFFNTPRNRAILADQSFRIGDTTLHAAKRSAQTNW